MTRGVHRLAAVVAILGAVLTSCSDGQVGRSDTDSDIGFVAGDGVVTLVPVDDREPAPAFTGPLLDGGEFDLAAALGDVVVLNVWGSWCAPCRKEAPGLQAAYEEFAKAGVQFVGVNTRDTGTNARAFQTEFGITYPSVFDPKGEALLAFRDQLPPAAIPSTLVVDRQGRMAARVVGPISEESLRDLVSDIANETEPTP